MKRIIGLIFLGLVIGNTISSQTLFNKPVFVSPGVSVGYTFNAKMNLGLILDVGLTDKTKNGNNKYGLSFYQYYVFTGKYVHRLRSFSLMYQNDYACIKFGRGRAKNPWGYSNRNRCIVHGLALDVSFSYPSVYSPWLGYRYFKFNRADWAWFNAPYKSVYLNYKYDVIQNTGPTNTTTLEK